LRPGLYTAIEQKHCPLEQFKISILSTNAVLAVKSFPMSSSISNLIDHHPAPRNSDPRKMYGCINVVLYLAIFAGVYTEVAYFIDWIQETMQEYDSQYI
jgi:hypothetical protein